MNIDLHVLCLLRSTSLKRLQSFLTSEGIRDRVDATESLSKKHEDHSAKCTYRNIMMHTAFSYIMNQCFFLIILYKMFFVDNKRCFRYYPALPQSSTHLHICFISTHLFICIYLSMLNLYTVSVRLRIAECTV